DPGRLGRLAVAGLGCPPAPHLAAGQVDDRDPPAPGRLEGERPTHDQLRIVGVSADPGDVEVSHQPSNAEYAEIRGGILDSYVLCVLCVVLRVLCVKRQRHAWASTRS